MSTSNEIFMTKKKIITGYRWQGEVMMYDIKCVRIVISYRIRICYNNEELNWNQWVTYKVRSLFIQKEKKKNENGAPFQDG